MTEAHIGSVLPIKNRVLAADEHTALLAHYDLNEHDVLRGTRALGSRHALVFNGLNTYVECGNVCNMGLDDMTIEAWIRTSKNVATTNYLVSKSVAAAAPFRYGMSIRNGKLAAFMQGDGGGDVTPVGATTISDDRWHHVAIVFKRNDNLELYVDGNLDGASVISQWSAADMESDLPFRVGAYTSSNKTSPSFFYTGELNNLRVTRRAKSPEELKQSMKNVMTERGLMAIWCMNEGHGNILKDTSPFHNDAIVVGDVEWGEGNSVFTLRPEEGKFGGAIAVEESTANQITNPTGGFVSPWGSWEASQVENLDNQIVNGLPCTVVKMKVRAAGTANALHRVTTMLIDKQNTLSFYAKLADEATVETARIDAYIQGGYASYPINKSKWSRVVHTKLATAINHTIHIKHVEMQTVLIALPQVEGKAFATSFVENSRSTGTVSYDLTAMGINPKGDWTISGWFKRHPSPSGWASAFGIGNYYREGESEFTVWTNHAGRVYPHVHDNRAGGGTILLTSNAQELDDWFYLAVSHDGALNQFTNYIWTKDRYAKSTFIDNIINPMEPTLHVGRSSSASHMFNGMVDELRIDKVVRTEEEILAWYESNSPFWPRGIYRKSY